jgi:carbon monoxide dehydrogenase subunit G
MRREIWIDRSADDVWAVVGDPLAVTRWFPGNTAVEMEGDQRTITLASGLPLIARIAIHPELRRFQYRLLGALPVDEHLTSIDVIPVPSDGDGSGSGAGNGGAGPRCLVVYSTDVVPHALAPIIDGAVGEALESLQQLMESTESTDEEGV